ncbi:MAG: hypothetical protein NTX11_02165 [Candidatus Saccharibacteria bacterium]|nr:hypothetical protein [Candidatus Saccharibacteria bacterium]
MSKRLRLFGVWGALCLIAVASIGLERVHAADPPPTQGIQISPVLIDLNTEKSNSYSLKITVTNVTAGDLALKQVVNDFRAKDDSGNPEVILDNSEPSNGFSFKNWVSLPPSIVLKSKESRVINATVNVPNDAEAGGHYGVIRFSGVAPGEENANVSIAASVGVLVLARVNGTISESLKLKDFYAEHNGKKTSLLQNGPLQIVERVENNGNVHVKPKGTITVKNMFGSTVLTTPISDPAKNILPNSNRKFSQEIKQKWMFGRYTARLDATYGYGNKVLSGSFSYWVIPYKLILIVLLVLAVCIVGLRFGLKRYNEKIINKAMNRRR